MGGDAGGGLGGGAGGGAVAGEEEGVLVVTMHGFSFSFRNVLEYSRLCCLN